METGEIIYASVWFVLLSVLIWRWKGIKLEGLGSAPLLLAFWLKVLGALSLWGLYTYYYPRGTSDAFRYFDDAMVLRSYLFEQPSVFFKFLFGVGLDDVNLTPVWEKLSTWSSSYNYGLANDNPTVIRLNMLIGLFSFGYYQVHALIFCLMGFLGLVWIHKGISLFIPAAPKSIFALVFLLPSVVFWASGILKESVLILALGGLILCTLKWLKQSNQRTLLPCIALLAMLWFIKGYVLLCLLPGWIILVLSHRFHLNLSRLSIALFGSLLIALLIGPKLGPDWDIAYVLGKKQTDMYNVARSNQAGSVVDLSPIEGPQDVLKNIPPALWHTYMRPGIWELDKPLYVFAAVENLLYMLLVLLLLIKWRRPSKAQQAIALWFFSFALSMGILIGNVVPILGASIRYKVPALPLLLLAALLCSSLRLEKLFSSTDNTVKP